MSSKEYHDSIDKLARWSMMTCSFEFRLRQPHCTRCSAQAVNRFYSVSDKILQPERPQDLALHVVLIGKEWSEAICGVTHPVGRSAFDMLRVEGVG